MVIIDDYKIWEEHGLDYFDSLGKTNLKERIHKLYSKLPKDYYITSKFEFDSKQQYTFLDFTIDIGVTPESMLSISGDDFNEEFDDMYDSFIAHLRNRGTMYYIELLTHGFSYLILNGSRKKSLDRLIAPIIREACVGVTKALLNTSDPYMEDNIKDTTTAFCGLASILRKYGKYIKGEHTVLYVDLYYGHYLELYLLTPDKYVEASRNVRDVSSVLTAVEKVLRRGGLL